METTNNKLKGMRNAAGLTQAQLAQMVGCHQKDISRWESGRQPMANTLKKLADALGCKVDELL